MSSRLSGNIAFRKLTASSSARDSLSSSKSNSKLDPSARPYTSPVSKFPTEDEKLDEAQEDDDNYAAYSEGSGDEAENPTPRGSSSYPQLGVLRNTSSKDSLRESQPNFQKQDRSKERSSHLQSSLRSSSVYSTPQKTSGDTLRTGSRNSSLKRLSEDGGRPVVASTALESHKTSQREIRNLFQRQEEPSNHFMPRPAAENQVPIEDGPQSQGDTFYRRATHRSSLLEFIPPSMAQPAPQDSGALRNASNLPDWDRVRFGEL